MSSKFQDESRQYKERMRNRKQIVDETVSRAQDERGTVILYTGDGKGKTTAAMGLVTRALGYAFSTVVIQFIKGTWECGEKNLLMGSSRPLQWYQMGTDFTWETQNFDADKAAAQALWEKGLMAMRDESVYLVVLDELTYALNFHWLDKAEVLAAIRDRPKEQSVIITGRGAKQYLRDIADTVSEMRAEKHAFASGLAARKGIEW
ncbi:corrinoid adenosyltransferase [Microbulbifer sp. NBRC 101763]|uniref:cob(I)yrinic acid a,c-diamide adenosyltransferase n=1 Tax=Microbulbifer TaxID=48073 RepID=UPI00039FFEDC|nr:MULTISPECIES: cob(I)yrinic acid a,c-diamide adenosyltransferase [Microbulbifer]WHI51826.1 cob(I)yrinic acid a,c-diamide adenosyltransferase [Microbulbifer sp. MLAF003]